MRRAGASAQPMVSQQATSEMALITTVNRITPLASRIFFDFAVGLQRHMHHMAIQIQRNRLAVKLHLRGQRRQASHPPGVIPRRRIRPAAQTQGDMAKTASRHQLAHPRRVGLGAAQGVDQLQQAGRARSSSSASARAAFSQYRLTQAISSRENKPIQAVKRLRKSILTPYFG